MERHPQINRAACIILYHPDKEALVSNIRSYIDFIDVLYVVDNTEIPNQEIIEELNKIPKIKYHANMENYGIAKATNIACDFAIKDGYEWILTFDQDSTCLPETIDTLYNIAINSTHIGIAAPVFIPDKKYLKNLYEWYPDETFYPDAVIASCSLISLKAFAEVGGMREDYFIDLVDLDFCLRLLKAGYRIIQTRNALIIHPVGDPKYFALGKYKFWYTNHSPLRRYYITRNRLDFCERHKDFKPDFIRNTKKKMIIETLKILLFEKQKYQKLKATCWGYQDFKKGEFGKTERNF